MTDRIQHLTVYLDKELRDDAPLLEQIEQAIGMITNVARVKRGEPTTHEKELAKVEVDAAWLRNITDLVTKMMGRDY